MQLDTDYTHHNVKKEHTNNHFCKRSRSQIDLWGGRDWHIQKNDKMRNYNDSSISEHQMMRILKTKPSDNDKIARISKRSTLSNQEYENWWYDSWFTDEFSEELSELSITPEDSIRNL